jgi:hypothetical protein
LGLELDIYKNIGLKKLKERADKIYQNKQFSEKISFALGEIAREKKKHKKKRNWHMKTDWFWMDFQMSKTRAQWKNFSR